MRSAERHIGSAEAPGRPAPDLPSGVSRPRWSWSDPLVQDAALAVALAVTALIGMLAHLHVDLPEGGVDSGYRNADAIGVTLVLLQTLPLIWRRRAPVLVFAVCSAAMIAYFLLGYFPSFASFGFVLALYSVAAHRDRKISIPVMLAAGTAVFGILIATGESVEIDTVFVEGIVVGAVWFIGDGLRVKRGQVVTLEDRATRLEHEREQAAQRAVAEERRVIARELHDMVAHNVSVIVAQAGAAQRVYDSQPEEARAALRSIEEAGREALVELRRLLGLLRTEKDRPDVRDPQQGLGDLEILLAQVREAGLPVELGIEGSPRPLPAGLDLSAFRIIQEALTNVLKHAGPARAQVRVRFEDDRVQLRITDDGWGADALERGAARARYGHLGMRERVSLFQGELRVGPRPGGGYEVAASIPTNAEPS